jgi:hypothetical protein
VTEENRPPDQQEKPVEEEPQEEVIDVTLLDRILACLALIYPFSLLVDKMQELLLGRVAGSVNNMLVLASIIGFLVLVNSVAKRLYAWRQKKG